MLPSGGKPTYQPTKPVIMNMLHDERIHNIR